MPIQPTLDTEIETLTQAIASKREHIARAQYIAEVQPMKDELAELVGENETIKASNAAFIAATPPTPEEVEKERKSKIASEIAFQYTLADEMSMVRKLFTGESKLTDVDIVEWFGVIDAAKLKYPKV